MSRPEPEVHGMALREAKLLLRNRVLAARDALDPAVRERCSVAITRGIVALPAYDAARAVLLTLAFRSEWSTDALIRHALAAGKTVALPRVDEPSRMLVLHRVDDPDRQVAPGYRGIPEPLPGLPGIAPEAIEWILVPGVAFDRGGRRLGYGGGFYDRLLPLTARAAQRVGASFGLQVVEHVPSAPHDVTVDALVTEDETLLFARA